jgi:hypothetical protein
LLVVVKLSLPVSVGWACSASLQGFSPGHGVGWTSHSIAVAQGRLAHQGEEGPQSGSIDFGGLDLDSGGKQCCLIKALKALSLAFSLLSCSVSFSICFVLSSICSICFSIRSLFCLSRKIAISVSLVRCS